MTVTPFHTLGHHLARGRQAAGLTHAALAAGAGLTIGAVERLEAGLWRPTPPRLERIAALIGTSFAELATAARYATRERCNACEQ